MCRILSTRCRMVSTLCRNVWLVGWLVGLVVMAVQSWSGDKGSTGEERTHLDGFGIGPAIGREKKVRRRKAPGPDHIPGKFAKWMISSFHDFFLLLYNSCLTLGHFPTAWKIGRLALVPKPHSDGDFTSSHRPITLLSAFSKIFESLLCHRLSHLLENNNLLHPLQFGFRLSPSYISIYSSFLNNRQVTLEYRGFSCTTSPKRGCAQGSKSGPILWNIFFDPILSLPFPPGVHAQDFADDLQLVIHGDPNNLKDIAQISINLIIEWCLDNKLTLSPNKSSILPIFCSEPTIHIQNSIIPCVEDITILGVNFNSRFSFSPHLNKICVKILNLFPRLRSCANSYYGFGYRARKLFYHSVIEPTLTYAAPIWAEAADTIAGRSRLRSTQRKFCINAIHGFRTGPTFTSFALLRVLPIDHKLKLLSSLFKPFHSLPFKAEHPHLLIVTLNHTFSSTSLTPRFRSPPRIYHTTLMAPKPLPGNIYIFIPTLHTLSRIFLILIQTLHSLSGIKLRLTYSTKRHPYHCLSLLCTLSKHRCFHPIVHKCQMLLYNLLPTRKITLDWVWGHSGIEGNCRADALAKIGAATNLTTPKYKLASKKKK
ncbi:hypothetical protein LAZ67_2000698 [Cordylochernes scorpioides]|uniref:Reverse transcriptase domain-containing protein n=1 Tax=Cordylochernes scorpioides TaxID=51811 RepID=A0ABY6K0U2_9ARAC|nr:hypothetical protein LAZ67_2000698 [Cordylochernes scorpioides]